MITNRIHIYLLLVIFLGGMLVFIGKSFFLKKSFPWAALLFWILGVWSVLTNLIIIRDLNFSHGDYLSKGWHGEALAVSVFQGDLPIQFVGNLSTVILITGAMALMLGIINQWYSSGFFLWLLFIIFSLSAVISSLFGTPGGGLTYRFFFPALVMTVVWLSAIRTEDKFIIYAKNTCLLYIWGSLLAAIIKPDWALLTGFSSDPGLFSGFSFTLFGVSANANGLAPLALSFVFLDVYKPAPSRLIRFSNRLAAILVVIMTQSRTVYVASLLGFFVMWLYSNPENLVLEKTERLGMQIQWRFVFFFPLVVIVSSFLILSFSELNSQKLNYYLSGRFELWKTALNAWWNGNLLFGLGPSLWSNAKISHCVGPAGGQAHNMFVQTLSTNGLLGLIFLITFIIRLMYDAWRTRLKTQGISICLALMTVLRCLTESPLNSKAIDEGMLFMAIVIGSIIVWSKQTDRESYQPLVVY